MEKGIAFDIKRFAVNDGPGIRTVIFLKGCPLKCQWCHNPEGISRDIELCTKNVKVDGVSYSMPHRIGYETSSTELIAEVMKDQIFMEDSGGGVTFSGGEPLLQHDLLKEALQGLRQRGVHTAVDTSGLSTWNIFEKINPYTNLYLYDLKCIDNDKHIRMTGVSNAAIIENLKRLSGTGIPFHIRIPVIPTLNFDDEEMKRIYTFLTSLKGIRQVDLLPYHKVAQSKYERMGITNKLFEERSLSAEDLQSYAELFRNLNVPVTIGG
jgi:pyruvate formate lyase activating enzyme